MIAATVAMNALPYSPRPRCGADKNLQEKADQFKKTLNTLTGFELFSRNRELERCWLPFVEEIRTALWKEAKNVGLLLQSYRMISEEIANGRTKNMR